VTRFRWTPARRQAFARRLRRLREAAGLTPEALAAAAGVKPRTYGGWESGRHAPLLADALGCTMHLLGTGRGEGLSLAPTPEAHPARRRRALRR
jgi:transcriptional regulator with XRE-family HTH domain